jgi:hypothetical protein
MRLNKQKSLENGYEKAAFFDLVAAAAFEQVEIVPG